MIERGAGREIERGLIVGRAGRPVEFWGGSLIILDEGLDIYFPPCSREDCHWSLAEVIGSYLCCLDRWSGYFVFCVSSWLV